MQSCLYEGRVHHLRRSPVHHAFELPLFMLYVDLDELPTLFRGRWLWSVERPAPARFRREDYLGPADRPLDASVRDLVERRAGMRPRGPIRLLTHLRYFGYVFNPVSLYYCYDRDGRRLESIVADVTNVPWKERHAYVLIPETNREAGLQRFRTAKEFHVSPFMGMDVEYDWTIAAPGRSLRLSIESREPGRAGFFHASLALRRREITSRSLALVLARYPLMTAQVLAAIYWQAYRLRRKGVPTHARPGPADARTRPATAAADQEGFSTLASSRLQ